MILAITAVHLGDVAMVGLLVVGLGWIFHLGRRLIDLGIDAMRDWWRRHHEPSPLEYADFYSDPDDMTALADAIREIAPEDEPSWPGKAPMLVSVVTAPEPARFDLTSVLPAAGALVENESETSGRHARVDADDTPTGLMPPVDDELVVDGPAALEAVAAVSGQDGAA